ncbi:MAG: radical SAM protein [Paludibacteraceae bacterium]|nr:radical SAM protein [Paludibacteraceae bacterium]
MNLLGLELARIGREVEGHPLRQIFWECTLKCNLCCGHCGSDCKVNPAEKDMPAEDFMRVLDQVRERLDPHKIMVVITGGEPLMRQDLEQCGRMIYDKGFPWGVVSNGYALTEQRLVGLLKAGIHSLTISLDGLREEHDWLRGREGSFDHASKAIEMVCRFNKTCEECGEIFGFSNLKPTDAIKFDVVTCVNRRNVGKLREIKDFLVSLGLRSWRLFTIFPVGRAADVPDFRLTKEEMHELMRFIIATRKEGKIHAEFTCEGFVGEYEGKVRDYYFCCDAGKKVASVLIDGSISACTSIRMGCHQGNIYKDNFMDVWERGFSQYRDREWMRKKGKCSDCKYWRWCKGGGMHLRDANGKLLYCTLDKL